MSTAVTTTSPAGLPAMYGGESDLTANDIIMPRIELVQGSSNAAKDGIADEGDIIWRYGSDDDAPSFLVGGPDKTPSFVGYVLMREKFAATTAGGTIEYQAERDMDDPDSWEGWKFYIAVPSVDGFMPASWQLWKTSGAQAAKAVNSMMVRRQAIEKKADPVAVKFTVKTKANRRGQLYKVPVPGPATADPADYKVAVEIQQRLSGLLTDMATENARPRATLDQPSFV